VAKAIISGRLQWLMSVILATWEAEIQRVLVQCQFRQIVLEIPISKITRARWTRGVAKAAEYLFCEHLLYKHKV
jgi:hypothetical protein